MEIKRLILAYSQQQTLSNYLVQYKFIETENADMEKNIRNLLINNNTRSRVSHKAAYNQLIFVVQAVLLFIQKRIY